jgi:hypothetical protein
MTDITMHTPGNLTRKELEDRLGVARMMPGIAHLLLSGPSPTCTVCGGVMAPIVDGKHISAEFCDGRK